MKNWKKLAIFMLFATMLLLPGEVSADSISFSDPSIKNVCIVIAVIIIALLLYLGYRLDSNDNTPKTKQHKSNAAKKNVNEKANYIKNVKTTKPIQDEYDLNDREYEEDVREYEVDNVNPEEISESIEYEEDDDFDDIEDIEDSSYNSLNNVNEDFGSTRSFDSTDLKKELLNLKNAEELNNDDFEEDNDDEDDEEFGEEFDISIIDRIDEEDDDVISLNKNDDDNIDVNSVESSFIQDLKDFKEPEIEFEGFSVGNADKREEVSKQENKDVKKYTRTKAKDEMTEIPDVLDDDFLKQMEKNLEIGKGKNTTSKKSTRKKM